MKRALQICAIFFFAGLLIIQFFQIDRSAPPVNTDETLNAAASVPQEVEQILERSCSDCHSNATVYPWYATVQPAGWFLKNHIDEGRRELNFSIFNTYNKTKKRRKFEQICEQSRSHEMPPPSYLLIHRSAVLTDEDLRELCEWTEGERSIIRN